VTKLPILCLALLASLSQAQQTPDPCQSVTEQLHQYELKFQDWPQLTRYRDENSKLPVLQKSEARVVFLGDSITEFWKLSDSFPGKPYINRGISGQTTPQILLRLRQDVIDLKPKVVVILAGTNDIAENTGPMPLSAIEGNLASMVELAHVNGIKVVLASVLPAARYPWRPDIEPVEKIRALNAWIKEYAAQSGSVFLDYFDAMADPRSGLKPALSEDGVHPTPAGYALMAPLAEKAIARALGKK
jgi:acyl-CoA thioesterase-1